MVPNKSRSPSVVPGCGSIHGSIVLVSLGRTPSASSPRTSRSHGCIRPLHRVKNLRGNTLLRRGERARFLAPGTLPKGTAHRLASRLPVESNRGRRGIREEKPMSKPGRVRVLRRREARVTAGARRPSRGWETCKSCPYCGRPNAGGIDIGSEELMGSSRELSATSQLKRRTQQAKSHVSAIPPHRIESHPGNQLTDR
jgi:hypothetical protein